MASRVSTRQPSNVRRRSPRTVKSCGPDARCWRQVGGGAFTPTGVRRRKTSARRRWQQSSSHRGEHEAAVKTIRAGKAWLLQAEPVVQPCAFLCARIAGASRRPAFPAPSFSGTGVKMNQSSGEQAARMRIRVCRLMTHGLRCATRWVSCRPLQTYRQQAFDKQVVRPLAQP